MASCVSVLRVGPFLEDNPCAVQIRTALLKLFASEQDNNQQPTTSTTVSPQEKAPPGETNLITLSNKYFPANILLEEIGSSSTCTTTSAAMQSFAEDGVVVVFDSALSNPNVASSMPVSFDAMEAVHARAVATGGHTPTAGDLLRFYMSGHGKEQEPDNQTV